MNDSQGPLVSVITPVYNMGAFLADCIESVLRQSYKNFEYIIVNNCSTDRTLEVALHYAKKDSRIRVHNNTEFVGVMENHNIALRLISPGSKYCKLVCADDFIHPDCLTKLVGLAEANPTVGIVGSYQLSGSSVKWQGFEYPKAVFSGREVARRIFLEGNPDFGFGCPTSLMYRADIVRNSGAFYPNPSPHSDTSACFKYLENSDFGFVYEVLAYERTHEESQSSQSAKIDRYSSAYLNDLIEYGPLYLAEEECNRLIKRHLNNYHRSLAINLLEFRDHEFWKYHKTRLAELGHPLKPSMLLKGAALAAWRGIRNPIQGVRRFSQRVLPKLMSWGHGSLAARPKQ
jgi:glycosyltransferase involved in cell wall biosynthesis